jgi:Ca2+/Na+ antiporter
MRELMFILGIISLFIIYGLVMLFGGVIMLLAAALKYWYVPFLIMFVWFIILHIYDDNKVDNETKKKSTEELKNEVNEAVRLWKEMICEGTAGSQYTHWTQLSNRTWMNRLEREIKRREPDYRSVYEEV